MKSQHVLSDRPATPLFTLLLAFAAMGCATRSFEPRFQAPPAPRPSVVVSELTQHRPRAERPVAVGLSADPMRLIAWDLQTGKLWQQAVDAKSAPLVAADAVVLQEAQGIVVRDLATGAVRCVLDESAALIGVDGEGDKLIVSMALALPNQPGELALIQGDSVRWRQRLGLPVGVPALFGEYVVIPWATQRLSVLSAADGQELGRYHFKNTVMSHAIVQDGKLYVGQLGLLPVDRELLEQPSLKRVPYAPAKRTLPGQPPLMSDGYVPVPAPDNAVHRLQLSWSVASSSGAPEGASEANPATTSHAATDVPREPLASVGNLLLLRFYRLVFGLDARSDELRWVRSFEHDVVGAAVLPGGVWLADSSGELRFLDQSGAIRAERALGQELRVLTLRPGPYTPPATLGDADPSALPALREQLASAAVLKDDRIAAARAYAVSMLARFGDAEVTSQLLALCSESDNPEPLRASACSELAGRKSGEGAILEALRRHGSFLEGRSAPPLGPLAQAAAKMQLKAAGPLLASHFEDPATSVRDLVRACEAISALEDRSAAPALERFVRLHHSEPEGSELSEPLAAAMRTLGKLRTPSAKSLLAQVTDDKLTPQKTRDQAKAVLDVLAAPPPEAAPPPKAAAAPEAAVQQDTRAYELSAELVRGTLAPFAQRLSVCFKSAGDKVRSARAQLVIDGEGTLEGVYVLPSALQACAEPILREAHFPATRMGRQRVSYNFTAEPQRRAETEPQPAPAKKPKPASARPQPAAAKPQVAN